MFGMDAFISQFTEDNALTSYPSLDDALSHTGSIHPLQPFTFPVDAPPQFSDYLDYPPSPFSFSSSSASSSASESEFSAPSPSSTPIDSYEIQSDLSENDLPQSMEWSDPRGLQQETSMSHHQRRLSHESSTLSGPEDRELSFAVSGTESTSSEGPHAIIANAPSTPCTSDDVREVEVHEVSVADDIAEWDGYRKEGKKWVCELCGLGVTARKSDLIRHLDTHGEKKFMCEKKCGKFFGRRDAMRRHAKTCGLNLKRGPKPGQKSKRARASQ